MAKDEYRSASTAESSPPRKRRRWGCLVYSLLAVLLPLAALFVVYLVLEASGNAQAAQWRARAVKAGDPLTTKAMQAKFFPPSAEIDEAIGHWQIAVEAMDRVHRRDPQVAEVPYWSDAYPYVERQADGFYDEATLSRIDEFLAPDGDKAIAAMHAARRAGAVARFPGDIPSTELTLGGPASLLEAADGLRGDLRRDAYLLETDRERNAARGKLEEATEDVLSLVAVSDAYSLDPTNYGASYQKTTFGVAYRSAVTLIQQVDLSDDQLRRLDEAFARQDLHSRLIDLVQAEQYRVVQALPTNDPRTDEALEFVRKLPLRGADEAATLELFQEFLADAKLDYDGVRLAKERLKSRLDEPQGESFVEMLPRATAILRPPMILGYTVWVFDMRTEQNLVRTGIACERYRRKHGAWPPNLEALVPEFLEEVPVDVFDGKPIRFEVDGGRLALHSIGQFDERFGKPIFDAGPLTFVVEKPQR